MTEDKKLVTLLGSLPEEYDVIVEILQSIQNLNFDIAVERLTKEYEKICERQTKGEVAFQALRSARKYKFNGRCNFCNKIGHKEVDCFAKERSQQATATGDTNQ